MSVVSDPTNEFDFAYKGYQYPIPPSWKYAVRLQDQIQWLLQAVLKVNSEGLNVDNLDEAVTELNAAIEETDENAQEYAANAVELSKAYTQLVAAQLEEAISGIAAGNIKYRNPVTGGYDYPYVVAKQIFDISMPKAMTWDEITATGKTWAEIAALNVDWWTFTSTARTLIGSDDSVQQYTPTADIDAVTPGYVL